MEVNSSGPKADLNSYQKSLNSFGIASLWNTCFSLTIALTLCVYGTGIYLNESTDLDNTFKLVLSIIQIASYIGLVIVLAYYAYRFSGRKILLLNGLFGVLSGWIFMPVIGLIIIYSFKRKIMRESKIL